MTATSKHHFELLTACIIYGTVGIFMEWLTGNVCRFNYFLQSSIRTFSHSMLSCNYRQLRPAFSKKKEKLPASSGNSVCFANVFLLFCNSVFGSFFCSPAPLYRSHISDFSCTSPARGKKYRKNHSCPFPWS